LFPIGTETAKDLLFARLRIQEEGAGYVHFSDTLNDEYFRQLTAEKVITKFVRGYKKRVYQKFRPRNEALDCYVYALGAYAIINTNVNSIADRIEAKSSVQVDDEPKEIKRPFVPRVKKNFVNAWR
jgi:phage terminase large subunit GpA-like protein